MTILPSVGGCTEEPVGNVNGTKRRRMDGVFDQESSTPYERS